MSKSANHYDLFDLPPDATPEEIRHAYHDAARRLHPDINPSPNAAEEFIRIQKAYDVLIDPAMRQAYDKKLEAEQRHTTLTKVLYSRPHLAPMDEPQLLYTLLDFSAPAHAAAQPAPMMNLCLVLDRSTSMQGIRMDTVKAAAIELIRQLKPEDQLSVVTFSDRAEVLLPAGKRLDRTIIESQIHMVQTGGGTELYQGLEASYAEINRYAARTLINHIILITDGRTYGDEQRCLELAERAAQQGIRITSLGIGSEWNDVLLDELATLTGGASFYVARPADIRTLLKEKFANLSQIFAERVMLHIEPAENVTLKSAFRLQPEPSELTNQSPIRLGGIAKDNKLSVLLEFVLPPFNEGKFRFSIAAARLDMTLPSDPQHPVTVPLSFSRLISAEPDVNPPPREIFQALSQITLYRMQERARQEISNGQIQEASLRLQRLATQLLSIGEVGLAQTAIMEADRIQQTHMLSADGEKQIKYGTRAFLLPAQTDGGSRL